jgi:hypothetical protein
VSLSRWYKAISATALTFLVSGCVGGARPATSPQPSSATAGATREWTAEQLEGALLPEPSSVGLNDSTSAYKPVSGPYSYVTKSILGEEPWPEDPTGCVKRMSVPGRIESLGAKAWHAPSAVLMWPGESGSAPWASLTLVAVPGQLAERLIGQPVAAGCWDYPVSSKNYRYAQERPEPLQVGQSGVLITSHQSSVQVKRRVFRLIFHARGYLAVMDIIGNNTTKAIAVQYAKQQYDRAERVLR